MKTKLSIENKPMKEQLISYETAKLAKEKGFDEACTYGYYSLEKGHKDNGRVRNFSDAYTIGLPYYSNSQLQASITAPTQALLQKWLREIHAIDITVDGTMNSSGDRNGYFVWIKDEKTKNEKETDTSDTYEEALEIGLLFALQLIRP